MLTRTGNSNIRHSRAKVLGGCSSHNTLISFRPLALDCERWEAAGAAGWGFDTFSRLLDKLRMTVQPVGAAHRNQLTKDWVSSCVAALDIPVVPDFCGQIRKTGHIGPADAGSFSSTSGAGKTEASSVGEPGSGGTGFFSLAYDPETGIRSSASVAYVHPILRGDEPRSNLTVLTGAWVSRINVAANGEVTGINLRLASGQALTINSTVETILSAGAVDTPRLLLHSGIGPAADLRTLGIPVVADIPGVGENLLDHPETILIYEVKKPTPPEQTAMHGDAGVFLRCPEAAESAADSASDPNIMMHCYQVPFTIHTAPLGYDVPRPGQAFCMTPNVPRPRSRGRLYLTSADPAVKPALDFRYFTDAGGADEAVLVAGLKAARAIAATEPFRSWIAREIAPGPSVTTDAELSAYGRKVHHTVYHPAGTTKMGNLADPLAVVDPALRVRGLHKLRIADAGVFPEMTTVNPMLTVLAVGERAAEMVAEEGGWRRERL